MADRTWTADRRLYLDKDGNVVEEGDPARATLLVPQGGTLPIDRARALGLADASAPRARDAAGNPVKAEPANKAATPATATKADGTPEPATSEPGAPGPGAPEAPSIPRRVRKEP